ncbi:hypothetical protein FB451DRAFT_1419557 [Mycena latifolia]|nr:hypothetical protein FB451DRAFT_1419557 [Mycena latifolia]
MYSSDLHPLAIQLTLASVQRIASQRIAHVLASSVVLQSQSFPALDIDPSLATVLAPVSFAALDHSCAPFALMPSSTPLAHSRSHPHTYLTGIGTS